MDTEQQILCLAARTDLDASTEARLLELLHGPVDWDRLWAQGHVHEVLPLVANTLRRLDGRVPIPAAWMEQAQRRMYATLVRNTTLTRELCRVLAALGDAGIDALPVKGVVLAKTVYGNLALRPASDLDLLIRPRDLPSARAILHALGFEHRAKLSFAAFHHPYHDPQYYLQTAEGEVCLELHWGLWDPRYFRVDIDVLWDRAITTRLQDKEVRLLSPEDTLLHLAIHRSRSPLRLRLICDIAEFLHRYGPNLDWDYELKQAYVAGARTALFSGLALAQKLLGAPVPPVILSQLGISRIKQVLLDHVCGARALFRFAAPNDLSQQPHLTLRLVEQDGVGHMATALGYSLTRTGWKHLYRFYQPLLPRGK